MVHYLLELRTYVAAFSALAYERCEAWLWSVEKQHFAGNKVTELSQQVNGSTMLRYARSVATGPDKNEQAKFKQRQAPK